MQVLTFRFGSQTHEKDVPWLYRYLRRSLLHWMRQAQRKRKDPSVYVDVDGVGEIADLLRGLGLSETTDKMVLPSALPPPCCSRACAWCGYWSLLTLRPAAPRVLLHRPALLQCPPARPQPTAPVTMRARRWPSWCARVALGGRACSLLTAAGEGWARVRLLGGCDKAGAPGEAPTADEGWRCWPDSRPALGSRACSLIAEAYS